jgi:hypothetical protein
MVICACQNSLGLCGVFPEEHCLSAKTFCTSTFSSSTSLRDTRHIQSDIYSRLKSPITRLITSFENEKQISKPKQKICKACSATMADFQAKSDVFLNWFKSQSGATYDSRLQLTDLRDRGAGRGIIATSDIPAGYLRA